MTLDEFSAQMRSKLSDFENWVKEDMRVNPENWSGDFSYSDWWEQFEFHDSEGLDQ